MALVVELLWTTTQEKATLTRTMKARQQLEGTPQPQPELALSGPPGSQAPLDFVHLSLRDQEEKVFVSSIPPPVPRIIYKRALLSCSASLVGQPLQYLQRKPTGFHVPQPKLVSVVRLPCVQTRQRP